MARRMIVLLTSPVRSASSASSSAPSPRRKAVRMERTRSAVATPATERGVCGLRGIRGTGSERFGAAWRQAMPAGQQALAHCSETSIPLTGCAQHCDPVSASRGARSVKAPRRGALLEGAEAQASTVAEPRAEVLLDDIAVLVGLGPHEACELLGRHRRDFRALSEQTLSDVGLRKDLIDLPIQPFHDVSRRAAWCENSRPRPN